MTSLCFDVAASMFSIMWIKRLIASSSSCVFRSSSPLEPMQYKNCCLCLSSKTHCVSQNFPDMEFHMSAVVCVFKAPSALRIRSPVHIMLFVLYGSSYPDGIGYWAERLGSFSHASRAKMQTPGVQFPNDLHSCVPHLRAANRRLFLLCRRRSTLPACGYKLSDHAMIIMGKKLRTVRFSRIVRNFLLFYWLFKANCFPSDSSACRHREARCSSSPHFLYRCRSGSRRAY